MNKPIQQIINRLLLVLLFAHPAFAQAQQESEEDAIGPEILDEQPTKPNQAKQETVKKDQTKKDQTKKDQTKKDQPEDKDKVDTLSKVSIFGTLEQRSKATGSANAVSKEKLEQMEYDDVHQVVHQVPGAYVRDEDGFGLRPNIGLRGASSDRSSKVTLMEDGVLLAPAPYAAPAAYFFPMTTRMTGVEIFKGPSAIEYGPNTIGGAINMITRPIPVGKEVGLDLAAGAFSTYKAHAYAGYGGSRFGFLVEGLHLRSDGFKWIGQYQPNTQDFKKTNLNTGFEKYEAMAKFRWNNDPSSMYFHRIELKLGYATERSNETYLGLTLADYHSNPYMRYQASADDLMLWARTQIQLDHRFEIGDRFMLRTAVYRHDLDRTWRRFDHSSTQTDINGVLSNPSALKNKFYYGSLTGANNSADLNGVDANGIPNELLYLANNQRSFISQGVQSNGHLLIKHSKQLIQKIKFGLRLHQDQIVRKHTELAYQMQDTQLQRVNAIKDTLGADNLGATDAIAAHVLDEIQIFEKLSINPGLRLEAYRTKFEDYLGVQKINGGDIVILPGIGSYYEITKGVGVLGGVHRAFSPVTPGQLKGIKPELSTNYEFGFRSIQDQIKNQIELIGFFNNYENLTAQCTFSNGCTDDKANVQFNAGRVYIYGLELVAKQGLRIAKVDTELQATYTYTESSFQSNFSSANPQFGDVQKGYALAYVPKQQLNLMNTWKYKDFTLAMVMNYQSEMRDIAGSGTIPEDRLIPSRLLLDLAAHYDLFEHHRIYLKVDNVTDEVYIASMRPYGIRAGKPRQWMIGYKWTWK
jgi:Fe(3+) dicitrate transport protein